MEIIAGQDGFGRKTWLYTTYRCWLSIFSRHNNSTIDNDNNNNTTNMSDIYNVDEDGMMARGLYLMDYDVARQNRVKKSTNVRRFRDHYGAAPVVYSKIFLDLQQQNIGQHKVENAMLSHLDGFLLAVFYMYTYPTEARLASRVKRSARSSVDTVWSWIEKIMALKIVKVVWPEEWNNPTGNAVQMFLFTVDGTHCHISEPTDQVLYVNKAFYSHKNKQAGLNYELALDIYQDRLVWISGPTPAGTSDADVFKSGLQAKVPPGRKGIADRGYRGLGDQLAIRNSHDTDEVKKFKSRALARHETFNKLIKCFTMMSVRFRNHGLPKHKMCFEAIAVICQYMLENGTSLLNVNAVN